MQKVAARKKNARLSFFIAEKCGKTFTIQKTCSCIIAKLATLASQLATYVFQLVKQLVNQGALLAYIHMSMSVQIKVYNSIR